ncbi:acyl carrier protein [Saccharopolyspora sp. 5N708]|uniref:acyl carrier protein n=1 Tax=Saccharopolyspora sp. 5N708 TaxID=3457424 RepID=UPI003FD60C70
MQQLTPAEFTRILRLGAGGDEPADLSDDYLDSTFDDLGYDSLALLETLRLVEREHGVAMSDDAVAELSTPRAFLELINQQLAAAVRA